MIAAVTGASGHIGANLIRSLIEEKYEVRVLYHLNNRSLKDLDISIIKGSLGNPESLKSLCRGADVVFHLAAQISIGHSDPEQMLKTNVEGTRNVIEACRKADVKRLVHFSSIHAMDPGQPDKPMDETAPPSLNSRSSYERTKALGEALAIESAQSNGLEIVIVCPTAVIGPYDFEPSFLGQFFIRLVNRKIPALIEGGYNWVDVRDIVQGAISAAEKGRNGEKYILSGTWVNLTELTQTVAEVTNKKFNLAVLPTVIAKIGLPFLQIWSRINKQQPIYTLESLDILKNGNRKISYEKAKNELDYHPRPLKETLKDTYRWYISNNYI